MYIKVLPRLPKLPKFPIKVKIKPKKPVKKGILIKIKPPVSDFTQLDLDWMDAC